jgi:hypothetical protein
MTGHGGHGFTLNTNLSIPFVAILSCTLTVPWLLTRVTFQYEIQLVTVDICDEAAAKDSQYSPSRPLLCDTNPESKNSGNLPVIHDSNPFSGDVANGTNVGMYSVCLHRELIMVSFVRVDSYEQAVVQQNRKILLTCHSRVVVVRFRSL